MNAENPTIEIEHGSRCDQCNEWISDLDAGFNIGSHGIWHEDCGGSWQVATRGAMLSLDSVNGGPVVEYCWDATAHTVYRRALTSRGELFRGGSPWEPQSRVQLFYQYRLQGVVARWLYDQTPLTLSDFR